jgi:hypothetical protein
VAAQLMAPQEGLSSVSVYVSKSEAEIQGLLHPARSGFGFFLAWFQSLQLPSAQSQSPLVLIGLAPKSHVCLLKHVLNCEEHFPFFIFQSGLTVTGLERVYCNIFNFCEVGPQLDSDASVLTATLCYETGASSNSKGSS